MDYLYYGDNLNILREYISDSSIDLIYLDPPFNSKATYNIIFKEKNGTASPAQIKAFDDTWHWDINAEETYREIVEKAPKKVADLIKALRGFLGSNDMMAYLVMMAIRLVELHRVLKDTGSIYLHCDPKASHYLKLVMDSVFGVKKFRNEIIWWYETGGIPKKDFSRKHDIIFRYSKSQNYILNPKEVKEKRSDEVLRRIASGIPGATRSKGEYRHPCDVWKIPSINAMAKERLSYPTQKPESLLEKIVKASSNEGDLILDPFCGCGTSIVVAERLKRSWIGIDITYLAISVMKNRLKDTFIDKIEYDVIGDPVDLSGAEALKEQNPYQFEVWAVDLVGARPAKSENKKGGDKGIDGYIYFHDDPKKTETKSIIIQVKSGNINPSHIRDLIGTVNRERANIGVFITLREPTSGMITESVSAGFYESPSGHRYPKIQILTIKELLEGKKIEYPIETGIDITFKKARKHQTEEEQEDIFEE